MKKIITLFTVILLTASSPLCAQAYQLSPEFAQKFAAYQQLADKLTTSKNGQYAAETISLQQQIADAMFACADVIKNADDYATLYNEGGGRLPYVPFDFNAEKEKSRLSASIWQQLVDLESSEVRYHRVMMYENKYFQQALAFVNNQMPSMVLSFNSVNGKVENRISFKKKITEYAPREIYWLSQLIDVSDIDGPQATKQEIQTTYIKLKESGWESLVNIDEDYLK